eukprot:351511-Chlamydomonas_euryale.AAC.6
MQCQPTAVQSAATPTAAAAQTAAEQAAAAQAIAVPTASVQSAATPTAAAAQTAAEQADASPTDAASCGVTSPAVLIGGRIRAGTAASLPTPDPCIAWRGVVTVLAALASGHLRTARQRKHVIVPPPGPHSRFTLWVHTVGPHSQSTFPTACVPPNQRLPNAQGTWQVDRGASGRPTLLGQQLLIGEVHYEIHNEVHRLSCSLGGEWLVPDQLQVTQQVTRAGSLASNRSFCRDKERTPPDSTTHLATLSREAAADQPVCDIAPQALPFCCLSPTRRRSRDTARHAPAGVGQV